jgi:hypothetical protein
MQAGEAIAADVALELCEQIREENRPKWYSSNHWWCWGCTKFSKSAEQRCFANAEGNRGCAQVDKRFDERPNS